MIIYNLFEATRLSLLKKAKKDSPDRFNKRTSFTKNIQVERVGLLELTEGDDLDIYLRVGSYRVSVRLIKFKQTLNARLKKFKGDITKSITDALKYSFDKKRIEVACDCSDFKYRFAYMATQKKYGFNTDENRPAKIRNPKNKTGICKHIISVLNSPSTLIPKLVPYVRGYVNYATDLTNKK